jgi:5'-3' exonuclease
MMKPTTVILDGDLLAYKAACFVDKEGLDEMESRLEFDIKYWTPAECTRRYLAFSDKRENNYRREFWPKYKAPRENKESPASLPRVLDYLKQHHEYLAEPKLEADDIIGLAMSSGKAIGVSLDKDLKSVPGWLWNPEKTGFPVLITQDDADYWFCKQWIMGDSTDYIPGLYKYGPKTADKFLGKCEVPAIYQDIVDLYLEVSNKPIKYKVGSTSYDGTREDHLKQVYEWSDGITEDYILAQARCVRILREGEYNRHTGEFKLWTWK